MQRRGELGRKLEKKMVFEKEWGSRVKDTKLNFELDLGIKDIQKSNLSDVKMKSSNNH